MGPDMIKVDTERLLADLRTLAQFGEAGPGVNRLSFSPEDIEARAWLLQRMLDAGLDAKIDGVGNVFGKAPGVGRAVLIGSHTDTVPNGGWLDGAMGVIYGLELARALAESGSSLPGGIDVISFADEESTYLGTLGSRSFVGELGESEIAEARSLSGESLRDALDRAGYAGRSEVHLDRSRHLAYLEAHIEQGPRLEAEGQRIGLVTSIVGMRRNEVTFFGQADHAGTTPMSLRKDAGAALFAFAAEVTAAFHTVAAADTVWNFGHVVFEPGAGNVVPREARLLVEYRDPSDSILDAMEAAIMAGAEHINMDKRVGVETQRSFALNPVAMNSDVVQHIEAAARQLEVPAIRMPSGAGHDAMHLAHYVPTGMLFIPSIGGRSHDTAEDTSTEEIILGAQVLARAVESILTTKDQDR